MKNRTLIKQVGAGLVILTVTFLTYKFIRWNYWKVERAAALAKGIQNAPHAVNLTLSKENHSLFEKSFAYNPEGNYYIINQFDVGPYITPGSTADLDFRVNNRENRRPPVRRFDFFNMITIGDYHFVFTTSDCPMEKFLELKETMPNLIGTISTPTGSENKGG